MLRQNRSHILGDLYDGLYLQSMLQRCQTRKVKNERDAYGRGQPLPQQITRPRNKWQRFLDYVCLLCDCHRAGKTTTAIAGEQRPDEVIFWVASNSGPRYNVQDYLTNLLRSLQSLDCDGAGSRGTTDVIFKNAVERSWRRVRNYASRLSHVLDELREQPGLDRSSSILLDQLDELLSLRSDHVALCKEAYCLPQTEAFQQLFRSTDGERYNSWYQVRHYLGRLGTWRKAARAVVAAGATFPNTLSNCRVEVLSMGFKAGTPLLVLEEDPETVLARVLPNYRETPIFTDALSRIRLAMSQTAPFQKVPLVPAPHAEAVVLDHFLSRGLAFAHGDRYVGCSKPSCYCCRVYFESQRAAPHVGRAHNNVWIKWRLPKPMASHAGENDRVPVDIVRRMVNSIYEDLRTTFLRNGEPLCAMFDSTTGLSPSLTSLRVASGRG